MERKLPSGQSADHLDVIPDLAGHARKHNTDRVRKRVRVLTSQA